MKYQRLAALLVIATAIAMPFAPPPEPPHRVPGCTGWGWLFDDKVSFPRAVLAVYDNNVICHVKIRVGDAYIDFTEDTYGDYTITGFGTEILIIEQCLSCVHITEAWVYTTDPTPHKQFFPFVVR